jgi:hypothetical protein
MGVVGAAAVVAFWNDGMVKVTFTMPFVIGLPETYMLCAVRGS